jgi:GH24 family phage-related lysozyme (muramidase)
MQTSSEAVKQIAQFEGFRNHAYNDVSGNATIGVGHLLHLGPCTPEDLQLVWTNEQVDNQFAIDLRTKAEVFVHEYVRVPLTQGQFDALVSACFNLGPAVLKRIVEETGLNFGDYDTVPSKLLEFRNIRVHGVLVTSIGLTKRRAWEADKWVQFRG